MLISSGTFDRKICVYILIYSIFSASTDSYTEHKPDDLPEFRIVALNTSKK